MAPFVGIPFCHVTALAGAAGDIHDLDMAHFEDDVIGANTVCNAVYD